LTSSLDKVGRPGNSTAISPFALSRLFDGDLKNYHFCWDENDGNDDNPILWVISSRPVSVSESQVCAIRREYFFQSDRQKTHTHTHALIFPHQYELNETRARFDSYPVYGR